MQNTTIRKTKRIIVAWITDAPRTMSSREPHRFRPVRLEVSDWGDRANVQLKGYRASNLGGSGSARFGLYGYENYRTCPNWLIPILREAGYVGTITT